MKPIARFSTVLICMALAAASVTVSAQLTRTQRIPVGKLTDFYETGAAGITVDIPQGGGGEKSLEIRVTASLNEYENGSANLSSAQVATVIDNLQKMLNESATTSDDLMYELSSEKLIVSINGGPKPHFAVSVEGATAATTHRPETENRQVLKEFLELLKKGKAVLDSKP